MDRNQAEQEESGGVPSSSKRLPISQFRRAEDGMALPTRNNPIPGSKKKGHSQKNAECPPPHQREGGGCGVATGRGGKGPKPPLPPQRFPVVRETTAIHCAEKKQQPSLLLQDSCLS